jgi:hypothetical protein
MILLAQAATGATAATQPAPSAFDVLMDNLHSATMGATCILLLVAALYFLKFYRKSGDRLFVFFSAAFGILGINRLFFVLIDAPDEARTALYVIRLLAFMLILYAIIDKNRARRTPSSTPPK